MALQALQRIALRLDTDPTLWLERVVLRHLEGTEYLLLSPSGEIEKDDLHLPPALGWRRVRADRSVVGVKPNNLWIT